MSRLAVLGSRGASVDNRMRANVRSGADDRLYRARRRCSHTNLTECADARSGLNVQARMNDGKCSDINAGASIRADR
jgi:hypothetical protein